MISGSPFAWKIRIVNSGVSKGDSLFNRASSGFGQLHMVLHVCRSRFRDTPSLHASWYMGYDTELFPRIRACRKLRANSMIRTAGELDGLS